MYGFTAYDHKLLGILMFAHTLQPRSFCSYMHILRHSKLTCTMNIWNIYWCQCAWLQNKTTENFYWICQKARCYLEKPKQGDIC